MSSKFFNYFLLSVLLSCSNNKEKDDGSKEFTLMDAYGDVTPKVKDTDIKGQIVNLSYDQFNAIFKCKQDDIVPPSLSFESFSFEISFINLPLCT